MKKYLIVFLLLLCNGLMAQQSFSVSKVGGGKKQIVFIPGFACSGAVWEETVTALSEDATCHIITFSGFAGEAPQSNPSFANWIKDLGEYMRREKLQGATVVGHSLGGVAALWLGKEYADVVGKIVVVDALPSYSAIFNPAFKAQENPNCAPFAAQFNLMDAKLFSASQEQIMRTMIADTSRIAQAVDWSLASDRNTLGHIYCQFLNTDMRQGLSEVKCPALVLLQPQFARLQQAIEGQYELLEKKSIKYAPQGLHFIMYDSKDWFLGELKSFLNDEF